MSKYFDTKPGSLEEAVSAAQQAAIAISKKERGEKPKDENNFVYAAKMAKKNGEKTFTIGGKEYDVEEALKKNEDNTNDKSDDGDGLDKVQPKAVKKKFADRKDKDIDNDGDVDSSDKFLHKRRKAISKAMKNESLKETVIAMWQEAAKNKSEMAMGMPGMSSYDPSAKKKKKAEQKKTDTGMPMTPVDMSPKMPKMKNEKNKV